MQIELIATQKIIPYARNPRKNDTAIAKVAASLKEFGWQQPIVVDNDHVVIVGHTRLQAAQQLGMTHVPVHIANGLTASQIKAYRLADNRTHEEATWDDDLLTLELQDLQHLNFDLSITGFNSTELDKWLSPLDDSLADMDTVPDLEDVPNKTQLGDVWQLGNHTVMCGDSTDAAVVAKLLQGQHAHMVFTDPPYNVNYGVTLKDKLRGGNRTIMNDNLGNGFYDFLFKACQNALNHCTGAVYVCMSSSELDTLQRAFREAGGHWSTFIIWSKNTFTLGRSDYQRQYEPILYGWKEGGTHYWCGARNQSDIWACDKPVKNDLHPTMKPIELVTRAITNSSQRHDIVLDLFGGAGSTLIACEQLQRHARVIELDPKYCDVIVQRWQKHTGQTAQRIAAAED